MAVEIETDLDEQALRWADEFQAGTPITLNDGQAWRFPAVTAGDKDLLDQIASAPTRFARLGPLFELGYRLLTRNYGLTRDQVRILFPYHFKDWTPAESGGQGPSAAVIAAATGQSPCGRSRLEQILGDFSLHICQGAASNVDHG